MLVVILLITLCLIYLFSVKRKKWEVMIEIKNFRGIYHYLFVLLAMIVIMFFYLINTGISASAGSQVIVFLGRILIFHSGLAIILFSALSIGIFILERLPFSFDRNTNILAGIAVGFFVITLGLFILGAAGLLMQFIVLPFILLLMIPGAKSAFSLLKKSLVTKSSPFKVHIFALLIYSYLLIFISLVLITATRPLAIGFDGLGLYFNTSKLIAGYQRLTHGGDAYNWSIVMSLGFIMYNSTAVSLLLSFVPGILSVIVIYKICVNLGINRNWSLFSCALFYSLPNTIWLSKVDEKTDLAFLFISLCVVLLFTGTRQTMEKIKSKKETRRLNFPPEKVFWALCGMLVGFSFGIKYVGMLSIFAALTVLFYSNSGKYGAIGIFFLNIALIFGLNLTKFAAFNIDMQMIRTVVFICISLFAFFFAFRNNRPGLFKSVNYSVIFIVTVGLTFLPWAIKNISENGKFSTDNLLTGKSALPQLYAVNPSGTSYITPPLLSTQSTKISYAGFGLLSFSDEPAVKPVAIAAGGKNNISQFNTINRNKINHRTNSEKEEEIRRYLGYEPGIIRFISLPYDLSMKTNVKLISNDTGILLLILIPCFIFVFSLRQLPWNILKVILLALFLIVSVISVQILEGKFNSNGSISGAIPNNYRELPLSNSFLISVYTIIKSAIISSGRALLPLYNLLTIQGNAICFILISLFSIPIYFLFRPAISGMTSLSKIFIVFLYCILQYWLILSSGIIWYGIVGFALLPVLISLFVNDSVKKMLPDKFTAVFAGSCAVIWFLIILPFQFMPTQFVFSDDMSKLNFSQFIEPPFAKYAVGISNEKEVFNQFFSPIQQSIIKTLNHDKYAKIMNISAFYNYYIANNDERIYNDNQLGIFKDVYSRAANDKTKLAAEYKKNNIRYILVNLKTPSIDKTPDKSLSAKFDELMIAMVNNPDFRLVYTNRIVERPDGDMDLQSGGTPVKAKYDIVGQRVLDPGTDALFEIL
jgi:hypothetical protein